MGLDIQAAQTIEEEIKLVLRFNNNHAHQADLSIEIVQPYFDELTALIDMFNGVKALSFKDKELKALALSERLKMVTQFNVLRYAADRRYVTLVAPDCDQVAMLSTTTNHYRKEIQKLLTLAIMPEMNYTVETPKAPLRHVSNLFAKPIHTTTNNVGVRNHHGYKIV